MPKIPTFTSEARPTTQVGSVKSNLQIPLSQTVAGALSPVTDFIVKKAVQANDTQNRTEALRLGNEFTRELQTVENTIQNDSVLGVNKQAANAYYKEQTNNLITKFKLQSSNNATQTLFENNALSSVNRGIFRIDNTIEKNVFTDLQNQVSEAETAFITQALYNDNDKNVNVVDEFGMMGNVNDFDYATLQTNLTKLYTDAFTGKIPAPNLNEMIGNIPALVQGFQANKDIGDNPILAFLELEKGKESALYPDLNLKQREKLIQQASKEKNWIVHERSAIGDYNGITDINISKNSVSSSILPMLKSHSDAVKNSVYIKTEKTPIITLDSVADGYLDKFSNLFIKIDTQGYESKVFDGAFKTLKRAKGVLCELSLIPLYEGQDTWKDLILRLEKEGFVLWSLEKGFTDRRDGRTLQVDGVFLKKEN